MKKKIAKKERGKKFLRKLFWIIGAVILVSMIAYFIFIRSSITGNAIACGLGNSRNEGSCTTTDCYTGKFLQICSSRFPWFPQYNYWKKTTTCQKVAYSYSKCSSPQLCNGKGNCCTPGISFSYTCSGKTSARKDSCSGAVLDSTACNSAQTCVASSIRCQASASACTPVNAYWSNCVIKASGVTYKVPCGASGTKTCMAATCGGVATCSSPSGNPGAVRVCTGAC